jgi:hypothetical protein
MSEVLGSESAVMPLVDVTAAALASSTAPSRVGLVSLLVDAMEGRTGYGFGRYTLCL